MQLASQHAQGTCRRLLTLLSLFVMWLWWPQIPVYFIWVNKISYLTYAFAGVVGSEFQGLTLYDPTTGL
jgi:hypothetical protein